MLSVCVCVSLYQLLKASTNLYEAWYIMAPAPISTAYYINPSHQSVCLYVYPPIVARQQLGKTVTAATTTHRTVEELLDASISVRSVSYQMKLGD
jgi:hypothetical protein